MTAEGETAAAQSIIDQLKHDDCQIRATATGSLTILAAALGPERTRGELLPFLQRERPTVGRGSTEQQTNFPLTYY